MIEKRFNEFDAFAAHNAAVDVQLIPTTTESRAWRTKTFGTKNCMLQEVFSGSGLIAKGLGSKKFYTFSTPLSDKCLVSSGVEMSLDALSINEPGGELYVNAPKSSAWQVFAAPKELVEENVRLERSYTTYRYSIRRQDHTTALMREQFRRAMDAVTEHPEMLSTPAMRIIEADLLSLLLPAIRHQSDKCHSEFGQREYNRANRMHILKKTQNFIRYREGETLHVSDLSRHAGVPERTLLRIYKEFLGVSPRAYLILRQLAKVRKDLLQETPEETSVTSILTRWGVWELGRFSGRYKKHYGEYPIQTLRRTPPSARFV